MWGGMTGSAQQAGHYGPAGGGGKFCARLASRNFLMGSTKPVCLLNEMQFYYRLSHVSPSPTSLRVVFPACIGGGGGGGSAPQGQRHDIFVGNLAFNTTEEQLHQAFSELGRIIKVRMVTDQDTGKPRGFAFIEFEDPQAALSAIRNMNDYELNGRRLRCNFSNSSHLEQLAGRLGMDMSAHTQARKQAEANKAAATAAAEAGTVAVSDSLKAMGKGEMYDIIKQLKEVADKDPDEARKLLCGHPQLPEAVLFIMSKLDMIKTPVATGAGGIPGADMAAATTTAAAARPADPRAAAAAAAAPSDPRARDPRAAARAAAAAAAPPPPPPMQQQPPPPAQYGAPPAQPPAAAPVVAGLDPALVQQVMSLTPQQIAQLPPDKQQSIIALRQQITGGR